MVITREILKLRWILLVSSSFLLAPVCSALLIHYLRFGTALGHIRKRLKGMGEQVQVAFPDIQPNFKSRRRMYTSCISSHQGRAPGLNLCSLSRQLKQLPCLDKIDNSTLNLTTLATYKAPSQIPYSSPKCDNMNHRRCKR